MIHKAVFGLGFGDEGKGLVTNYLCQQDNSATVVRFSGGQQAGHNVVKDNISHVFSNFGSGTLLGNETYWSKYCTFDPVGFINELGVLENKGIVPQIMIDVKCPVTTPYEKTFLGKSLLHGTCGVGVGQTWEREEKHFSLLVEDLFYPSVLKMKLEMIDEYYKTEVDFSLFDESVEKIQNLQNLFYPVSFIPNEENLIFEGSQGLLLDKNIGFFPHVTRSNTGSKNILEMGFNPEVYCVTRAYQTRHGNGPMTNIDIDHNIKLSSEETNTFNEFQGNFRVSLLDIDLLLYSVSKDPYISRNRDNLVITCLDQLEGGFFCTYEGVVFSFNSAEDFAETVARILQFNHIYISFSNKSEFIKKLW